MAKGAPFPVAVTGSFAAIEWATYAPAKAAYVYVPSIEDAAARWGLRPNEVAPNVVLLEPGVVDAFQFENAVPSREGYPSPRGRRSRPISSTVPVASPLTASTSSHG